MPTLAEIAALLNGTVEGDGTVVVTGISALESSGPEHITFLTDEKYLPKLADCRAGAVLLGPSVPAQGRPAVRVPDPKAALPVLIVRFAPVRPAQGRPAVDPTAIIHPSAKLGRDVKIGAYTIVESGVAIGDGTEIGPLCFVGWGSEIGSAGRIMPLVAIGERTVIGDRALIHSGTELGSDGFGFLPGPKGLVKIPQIGRVVVGDDVEMGGNCTVDRGMVGDTVIGRGVKMDNQVHVAHNVTIGENTAVAGQVGLAGTARVGAWCQFGGQVGVGDHVTLGNRVRVGAKSGVHRDVADGEEIFGYPARPAREAFKLTAELSRLPRLVEKIRKLEARLAALERRK